MILTIVGGHNRKAPCDTYDAWIDHTLNPERDIRCAKMLDSERTSKSYAMAIHGSYITENYFLFSLDDVNVMNCSYTFFYYFSRML